MRNVAVWLLAGAVVVAGLSALIAAAPPRFRLILLTPVGLGLASGWGLGQLADELRVRRSSATAALTVMLTLAGLAHLALAGYRQVAAAARNNVARDPQQLLALRLLESAANDDPALRRRWDEERLRLEPRFRDYLAGRLLSFGWLPAPWPAVIWGAELLSGAAAAAWIFRRSPRVRDLSGADTAAGQAP